MKQTLTNTERITLSIRRKEVELTLETHNDEDEVKISIDNESFMVRTRGKLYYLSQNFKDDSIHEICIEGNIKRFTYM